MGPRVYSENKVFKLTQNTMKCWIDAAEIGAMSDSSPHGPFKKSLTWWELLSNRIQWYSLFFDDRVGSFGARNHTLVVGSGRNHHNSPGGRAKDAVPGPGKSGSFIPFYWSLLVHLLHDDEELLTVDGPVRLFRFKKDTPIRFVDGEKLVFNHDFEC